MTIIMLVLLLVYNCSRVEASLFQCPECDSHCTSEYAMWGFLIVSLPIVLFLQYLIDHEENARQPRVIYIQQ
jgi:hypothetical protein